jgi:transcriptional regulator with XRE-family HTH domain
MAHEKMRDRLFFAWMLYQAKTGGAKSQEWLAEAVSKQLGLKQADYLTQSSVSRWLKGEGPSIKVAAAIAKVLGVDPGWLVFGAASQAPRPSNPMRDEMDENGEA